MTGTLAGFRMPDYEQGISVAGYHSHFLDAQPTTATSPDYRLSRGTVQIGVRSDLQLESAAHTEFLSAQLNKAPILDTQIRRTEGE